MTAEEEEEDARNGRFLTKRPAPYPLDPDKPEPLDKVLAAFHWLLITRPHEASWQFSVDPADNKRLSLEAFYKVLALAGKQPRVGNAPLVRVRACGDRTLIARMHRTSPSSASPESTRQRYDSPLPSSATPGHANEILPLP